MKIYNVIFCLVICLFFTSKTFAQTPELRIPSTHVAEHSAFSSDDKMLATLGEKELKIWNTEGPYLIKNIPMMGSDTIYDTQLLFMPKNEKLLINQNGKIRFLNLKTFEFDNLSWQIENPETTGLSNDGKSLYAFYRGMNDKNTLQKLNLATGKMVKLLEFKTGEVGFSGSITLNSDESLLLGSCILDAGGVLIDLKTNKLLSVFKDPQWPLFFNEKGNIIISSLVKGENDDVYAQNKKFKIEEVDPSNFKILRTLKLNVKTDDIYNYNGIIMQAHNGKDKIVFEVNNRFYNINVKNFTVSDRKEFKSEYSSGSGPIISPMGNMVFMPQHMEAFQFDDINKIYQFGINPYAPFNMSDISSNGDVKAMVGDRILTFDNKNLRFKFLPNGGNSVDVQRTIYRYVASQKRVLMTGSTLRNIAKDYLNPEYYNLSDDTSKTTIFQPSKEINYDVEEMRVYDSLNIAIVVSGDRFFIMDSRNFKIKQQILYKNEYVLAHFSRRDDDYVCALSPDQTNVIIHLKKVVEGVETHAISCYDLINKRAIWRYETKNKVLSNPIYIDEGKKVRFFGEKGEIITVDALMGRPILGGMKIANASAASFYSPTQKYFINPLMDESNYDVTNYEIYNAQTNKIIAQLPKQRKAYTNIIFMNNDQFILTQDEDLKLWEAATGKFLARIIIFKNNADWIIVTPDGRFDGSDGGLKKMYYVKGREVIPLEQLYEGFYTPGLSNQVLSGTVSDVKKDINNIKSPPSVKLTYAPSKIYKELMLEGDIAEISVDKKQVQLDVEANANGDVIEEIRLYHNGKLVGNKTRNLVVEDEKSGFEKKAYDIELEEGENRFKLVAINSQRTESKADYITLMYKPKNIGNVRPTEGVNLYVLVIGLNKYKNPKYNLNYATADATAFKEAIEIQSSTIFSKINAVYIGDEKATKAGIIAELEKVKTNANPKDVFIFYYAGHGVLNEKKEFFLVPHDVTQLYGADDALAKKGLSAKDLQQFSKDIKAQKQLFILDACQSAGALETLVANRGAAEEKAIAQLARATGTHWLTASGSEQFASEFTQLGHGTFTYVLLEALAGKADSGLDKKISVKELDAYLQEVVPEITAKYKGTPQYPSSYGFGNDFPIGVVKQ